MAGIDFGEKHEWYFFISCIFWHVIVGTDFDK